MSGDEICQRCGTRFQVDHYCENNHARPRPKPTPATPEYEFLTQHPCRDKPAPATAEWTVKIGNKERAAVVIGENMYWIYDEEGTAVEDANEIAAAHKAALAAERENRESVEKLMIETANAVDKRIDAATKPLVEAMRESLASSNPEKVLRDALIKHREGKQ